MDVSFNLVASKCATEMAVYQNCVSQNQNGNWAAICEPAGRSLASCAETNVPHLAKLKSTCSKQITAYKRCLDAHGSLPDDEVRDRCAGAMKALWECSESVTGSSASGVKE